MGEKRFGTTDGVESVCDDYPSPEMSEELIDNRYGRECMAIEKNTAFNSPDTVASILESSFRARLAPHKVVMDIKNQYEPDAFWEVVEQ